MASGVVAERMALVQRAVAPFMGGIGYFRLSLTATEAMIEQALPVFADAIGPVGRRR
ncbi:MAG TPA: hypothetical protein VGL23_01140 [Chloroflexota bacterium]|jgi:hypothetical protein